MIKIRYFVFPFLLLAHVTASANMTVYPMAVGLDNNGEGNVRVISKSREVQFIRTKVYRIDNPGTPMEKENEITASSGNDVVVMPPKFAVPGGSSKLVRLVSMEPTNKERIYRVMFEGVPSLDDTVTANNKGIATQVSVNLVWGVLVSVPPEQPRIHLVLSPEKNALLNQGSQRVKIIDVGLCRQGESGDQCHHQSDNHNIFPDGTYSLPATTGYEHIEIKYKDWIKKSISTETFSLR
ncbi:fimbria/pilus periplasmic chaperone [Kluyvera georgiana]|uniref:fimbria/pilus periplasmic chaperone n=1 Tax=Kluyvera georgiana TaxID=73098 RepID=UPI003D9962CA